MSGIAQLIAGTLVSQIITPTLVTGNTIYTTAGTYSWVCPADVYQVSVVAVGAGGTGSGYPAQAGGGGLGWKNAISVTPGVSYTVVVGDKSSYGSGGSSGNSYFINTTTVMGIGGENGRITFGPSSSGGSYIGDGGGAGGNSPYGTGESYSGAGGAAGYSGNGGNGGAALSSTTGSTAGTSGSGGGGGGGSGGRPVGGGGYGGGAGGGVGIYGQGSNGSAGPSASTGSASSGVDGSPGSNGSGKDYGGGNSGSSATTGSGAVRIIWGPGRAFPSTNTT